VSNINIIKAEDKRLRDLILSTDKNIALCLNGDFTVVQSIIKRQSELLKGLEKPNNRKEEILIKYCYIFYHEWEVVKGMSQYGVGDLVFTDSKDNFLVMEVKKLSSFSGRNQSVKRRKARRKVEEQTKKYMSSFRTKHPV